MEQLNSMFTRLKRGIISMGDNPQLPEKQQRSMPCGADGPSAQCVDNEDEGFIVIDADEAMDRPACVSPPKGLAQQSSLVCGQNPDPAGPGIQMFATCHLTPVDQRGATDDYRHEGHGITSHPFIFDIPFQLNPALQEKDHLCHSLAQIDLQTTYFNWQKYSYDFDFEQLSLRELCALEDRTLRLNR